MDAWRKFLCLKTFDSQGTARCRYGVLTGSICNSIKAAVVTAQQEDMSALVLRSTTYVMAGAARTAAGTLIVDPPGMIAA